MSASPTSSQTTAARDRFLAELLREYPEIDPERVLFLNPNKPTEPWFPSEVLIAIARNTGKFDVIEEGFDQYIQPLNQVVHYASVTRDERVFRRSGVATIGESISRTDNGHPLYNRQSPDAHQLAASRALVAVLDAAGFNPYKTRAKERPDPAADLVERVLTPAAREFADDDPGVQEAALREHHLGQIHLLAAQAGLIKRIPGAGKDMSEYRAFLLENWGVKTVAGMSQTDRLSVINKLRIMIDQLDNPIES